MHPRDELTLSFRSCIAARTVYKRLSNECDPVGKDRHLALNGSSRQISGASTCTPDDDLNGTSLANCSGSVATLGSRSCEAGPRPVCLAIGIGAIN